MGKFILGIILATIIVFFFWNILKRLFFGAFYQQQKENLNRTAKKDRNIGQNLNWDAETVEYEEVKEEKKD